MSHVTQTLHLYVCVLSASFEFLASGRGSCDSISCMLSYSSNLCKRYSKKNGSPKNRTQINGIAKKCQKIMATKRYATKFDVGKMAHTKY